MMAAMIFKLEQIGMGAHDPDGSSVSLQPDAGHENGGGYLVFHQGRKNPVVGLSTAGIERERNAADSARLRPDVQSGLDERRGMAGGYHRQRHGDHAEIFSQQA